MRRPQSVRAPHAAIGRRASAGPSLAEQLETSASARRSDAYLHAARAKNPLASVPAVDFTVDDGGFAPYVHGAKFEEASLATEGDEASGVTESDALARKSPVPLVPAFVQGSRVTVEGYEGSTAIVTGVSKTGLWVSVNGSAPARVAP